MNAQDLKNSILQLAIQGKLVEQKEEEGTAKELLKKIDAEKKQLIKEGKIKKQKTLPEIKEDEIPFDIPESWEWVRLGKIGEIVGGGTPKTGNSEFWNGGNIPWLTPADMKFVPGKYVENGERFISEKGLKGSSARLMPKGTIIYSSRAPIGYIAIANNDLATNQGFKSLVPYELRINEYMYYCLISRTNEIISRASGTTFKEISGREFGLTVVPLPPLEEQKRIVAKIEELMPLVEKYDQVYSDIEELNKKFPEDIQKSILQYAIQGKLVEQREEEETAEELYRQIQEEKNRLIKEGKIKKQKKLPEISEEEIPFDIPESWEWVRLELVTFNIGTKNNQIKQSEILQKGKYPVVSQSMNKIEGYSDEESKLLEIGSQSVIVFGDHSKTLKLIDFDFIIGADGTKIMVPILMNPEYLFYVLNYNAIIMRDRGYSRHFQFLKEKLIPLPPLGEQKRIVDRIEELLPYCQQLVK